jgi:hypothetical protein
MYNKCSPTLRYALAQHVHVCIHDEDLVLLDLRQDRYFALEAAETANLKHHVLGWPISSAGTVERPHDAEDDSSLLKELLQRGILTDDGERGKSALPTHIDAVTHEWTMDSNESRVRASPIEVIALLVSAISAAMLLRYRPVDKVVARVRSRKAASGKCDNEFDGHSVRRLVTIFSRISPMFVSTKNACLYECLTLLEFLAWYGIYPTWVFGVQTRPFAAHCWTQHGDTVLNDTIDRTGHYTPIMAI